MSDPNTKPDVGRETEAERKLLERTNHSSPYLFCANNYSALCLFVCHLLSLEAVVSVLVGVGTTLYVYHTTDESDDFDGTKMNFVLLTFAVITPMSAAINITFARREAALNHLTEVRANLFALYVGHANWGWRGEGDGAGDSLDRRRHADAVATEILCLENELARFLALPNTARARHRITSAGRREARETLDIGRRLLASVSRRSARLSTLCEVLKRAGLFTGEATRLRQFERDVVANVERLRAIKLYRSPQALRTFARLFSLMIPPFYAPYYAQMARDLDALGMGVAFVVLTCLALTTLFESVSQLEDPFAESLDGIRVAEELQVVSRLQLEAARSELFPDAAPFAEDDDDDDDESEELPRRLRDRGAEDLYRDESSEKTTRGLETPLLLSPLEVNDVNSVV